MLSFDKQAFYFFRRWIWLKWRARNATLKHVLRAMFWLNRCAYMIKRSDYAQKVYALKSDLLRYLYRANLIDNITKQEQVLTCSFCGGDGEDPYYSDWSDNYDAPCRKCDGTGIYRRVILVKFCVGRYVWHQPAPLVDWLSVDDIQWDDQPKFTNKDEGYQPRFTSAKLREHWFAVVYMYLWRHRVNVNKHELARLRWSIDVHLPYRLRKLKYTIQEWWQKRNHQMVDDIPF